MHEFFYSHSEFLWMILGIVMIMLEMLIAAGFGFLFAGLGAFTTFALLEFKLLHSAFPLELAVFLTSSIAWWAILWYPVRLLKRDKMHYQGLSGSIVTLSEDIKKSQIGNVVWSGVRIRATLYKEEKASVLKKGTRAKIVRIKGNVLYLMQED